MSYYVYTRPSVHTHTHKHARTIQYGCTRTYALTQHTCAN